MDECAESREDDENEHNDSESLRPNNVETQTKWIE